MSKFEFIEPDHYWRTVYVNHPPLFLCNALHRCLFGWWLEQLEWTRDGTRFTVDLCWQKRNPFALVNDGEGKPSSRFRMYCRMGFLTSTKVLWLLAWSKPRRSKLVSFST